MKLYAETRKKRSRQIVQDLLIVGWIFLWISFGLVAHDVVAGLATPAASVARNSDSLSASLGDISDRIDEIPLVGGALEEPFSTASRASAGVARESREQRDRFLTAALWIGLFTAIGPIAAATMLYLPRRWGWIKEATAADRIRIDADDLYLFALRAATNRSFSELRKTTADPGAALAAGNYDALARLELEELGLRP
jgi:hypothetical protein